MPDGGSTGIGASVKRKEDYRFLVGEGNYTDDINRPNQTYTYMLRSSSAIHAFFIAYVFTYTDYSPLLKITSTAAAVDPSPVSTCILIE